MKFIATLAFVLISSSAYAQIPPLRIQAPIQPACRFAWDHPGTDLNNNPTIITAWALSINGAKRDLIGVSKTATPVNPPSESTGTYEIPCPAFVIGNSILVLYARNAVGETPTVEFQVIVDAPKAAPRPATGVKFIGQP